MINQDLTKIARLIESKGKIDKKEADAIMSNLSREDLAKFSRILTTLVNKNRVIVISESPIKGPLKDKIESMYADKNVIFEQQNIGDGIKLIVNDTIIDLSIESFIDSAANSLQV